MYNRLEILEHLQNIRNLEKGALDNYIEEIIEPKINKNDYFLETIYKDVCYLLDGIDRLDENDLLIENGDFVIEQGDIKLTGYQSRIHYFCNYLHSKIIFKLIEKNTLNFVSKMENFEVEFVKNKTYTPEYKNSLDSIKDSLKKEKKQNYEDYKFNMERKMGYNNFNKIMMEYFSKRDNNTKIYIHNKYLDSEKDYFTFLNDFLYKYGVISINIITKLDNNTYKAEIVFADNNIFNKRGITNVIDNSNFEVVQEKMANKLIEIFGSISYEEWIK